MPHDELHGEPVTGSVRPLLSAPCSMPRPFRPRMRVAPLDVASAIPGPILVGWNECVTGAQDLLLEAAEAG